MKAKDLIAKASVTAAVPAPSATALRELKLVLEHNDGMAGSGRGRVSATAAVELLQSFGWKGRGRRALDTVCAQLGRRSFGTP